jgi:S-(hydroxymethyl)glutathione dehydrogenase/alcohol dehydrogenase
LNGKKFSSGKVSTLTEQAIVSENKLTVIPSNTNPEFAALLGCSLTTALGIIENESYLRFGETVAVVGCGGVGLIVIAAARLRGAGEIYAVDNSTVKKDLSFDYGANFFHETVANLPENIDLLIDTTGNVEIISESFKKLSINGRILLVGQPAPDQSLIIPNAIKLFNGSGLLIKASQGGGSIPHEDIPRYLKLLSLGYLSIEKLITHRYKLSEVNEAFKTLKSGKSGRIMIGINK